MNSIPTAATKVSIFRWRLQLKSPGCALGRRPTPTSVAQLNKLGNALWTIGEGESDSTQLEEAVMALREALKHRTRKRVPLDWAANRTNLDALAVLGARETSTARLEQSVAASHEALKERTRKRMAQLGYDAEQPRQRALNSWRAREDGTAQLQDSVAAYHEALKELSRDRAPLDWAMTQNNLGNALASLGERGESGYRTAGGCSGGLSRGTQGADTRARHSDGPRRRTTLALPSEPSENAKAAPRGWKTQ